MTFLLYEHAAASELLNSNQFGSLRGLLVDDAAITLTHDIRTLQACKHKMSTLFQDIQGGFDNVQAPILAAHLRAHGTPEYMIYWVTSLLTNRTPGCF